MFVCNDSVPRPVLLNGNLVPISVNVVVGEVYDVKPL
jgi:hypothetical protein